MDRMMSERNHIPQNPNSRGKTTQRNSRRSAPVLRGLSANQSLPPVSILLCLPYSLLLLYRVYKKQQASSKKKKAKKHAPILLKYHNLDY